MQTIAGMGDASIEGQLCQCPGCVADMMHTQGLAELYLDV